MSNHPKPLEGEVYVKHRQIIGYLLAGVLCAGPAMAQELTGTLKNIKDTGAIAGPVHNAPASRQPII